MAYDEATLGRALVNADKAGDVDAARTLAAEIVKLRGASPVAAEPPKTTMQELGLGTQSPAASKAYTGSVLPFSTDDAGNTSFDSNAGILGSIKRGIMAPGEALQNKFDPMSKEGIGKSLASSLLMMPGSPSVMTGSRAFPGEAVASTTQVKTVPAVPTAQELKTASNAGYKAAQDSGVEYHGAAVKDLVDTLEGKLAEDAHIPATNPKTFNLLRQLQDPPEGSTVQLKFIDAIRKKLGQVAADPDEARAATIAIKDLDRFLEAPDPAAVVARTAPAEGNAVALPGISSTAEDVAKTLVDARANAAAGFRDKLITNVEDNAGRRSAATDSGANSGNTLRQRLASVLANDKKTRGFSDQEISAIEDIVKGDTTTNATRNIGKLLGGGGGLGAALYGLTGAVSATANPGMAMVAGLPVVGAVSKAISNSLTKSQVQKLSELLRSRSPLYEEMKSNAPMAPVSPEQNAALAAALRASMLENKDTPR